MTIGLIGLGHVGGKFTGSILSNGYVLAVRNLDKAAEPLILQLGARHADCAREMAETRDTVICMFETRPGKVPTSSMVIL